MAVVGSVDVIESQLWPQRDARDPLGIFGWRSALTGDATGGSIKLSVEVPDDRRHAYVYKIYDLQIGQILNTPTGVTGKMRILTNWPNIDAQPGVQAYGALWIGSIGGDVLLTAPFMAFLDVNPFSGNSKELLIYDPSTRTGAMVIAEQEVANTNTLQYTFEGYGYYWDRAVMAAPGGPRNPGTT